MRVVRWKNAATGVQSLTITEAGIYFPVGKEDGSFIGRYVMASAGQTASVEIIRDSNGTRVGVPGVSVSGVTEIVSQYKRSLAYGIIVTAISGTLTATLDDQIVRTIWPDNLGRFPAQADLDAFTYRGTGLDGCTAMVAGVQYTYGAGGWVIAPTNATRTNEAIRAFSANGTTSSAGAATKTFRVAFRAPCSSFGRVKIGFRNKSGSNVAIGSAHVGRTAESDTSVSRLNSDIWAALTIDGGALTIPSSSVGAITWTDWVELESIAANDGGNPWLIVSGYDWDSITYSSGLKSGGVYSAPGFEYSSYGAIGDFDSTNQTGFYSASYHESFSAVAAVMFETSNLRARLIGFGGSFCQGVGDDPQVRGWLGMIGERVADVGCDVLNWGYASSTSEATASRCEALLANTGAQVTIITGITLNDGPLSIAIIKTMFNRIVRYAHAARNAGAFPIVVFPALKATPTSTEWDLFLNLISMCKAAGMVVIESYNAMFDLSTNPPTYKPGYSDDAIHPNTVGATAIADYSEPYIRSIIGMIS